MSKPESVDWAIGLYAATLAMVNGMMDQGAIDRGKMIVFVENLLTDLKPEERESPYGVALEQALQCFEKLQPLSKIAEWRP